MSTWGAGPGVLGAVPMGAGLTIVGGGVSVDTEDIYALAERSGVLAERAAGAAAAISSLGVLSGSLGRPSAASLRFSDAAHAVRRAADRLTAARHALTVAARRYTDAEDELSRFVGAEAAAFAYAAGAAAGVGLMLMGPSSILLAAAAAVAAQGPLGVGGRAAARWLNAHPEILADARFLALVRTMSSSVDDAARGLSHLPFHGGQPGSPSDIRDREQFAAALLYVVSLGSASSTRVETTKLTTGSASAPRSLATLAARIPGQATAPPGSYAARAGTTPTHGGAEGQSAPKPQIRIERYEDSAGAARYVVYLAGTADFGLQAGQEPFDMTSNIAGMANLDSAALEATRAAMATEGIDDSTPVLFVGYSQGGLIAERLADSGDYATAGVVTFGSPGFGVAADEVPVIALAHSDDVVPALGGLRDHDSAPGHLTVQRSALGGAPFPEGQQLPAHAISAYRYTAGLADDSADPRLHRVTDSVFEFLEGSSLGTGTDYRAVRSTGG